MIDTNYEAFIQTWGNGLGLRIAKDLRRIPGFKSGDKVFITVNSDGFSLSKTNFITDKKYVNVEDILED